MDPTSPANVYTLDLYIGNLKKSVVQQMVPDFKGKICPCEAHRLRRGCISSTGRGHYGLVWLDVTESDLNKCSEAAIAAAKEALGFEAANFEITAESKAQPPFCVYTFVKIRWIDELRDDP